MAVILRICVPANARAPAAARAAVRGLSAVDDDIREVAGLLVSELVTNAVLHAGLRGDDEIEVVVHRNAALRIEVADGGPGIDGRPRRAPVDGEGGRGLFIVDALAARWGVERFGHARVWFELDGRAAADGERRPRPSPAP